MATNPLTHVNPLVSVIVPCYNASEFVAETVRSVLDQSFPDFELIVVDDGSRDDSAAIVASISDPRLKLLTGPNAGVASARNRGLAAARGEYVAFLDADDLYLRNNLEAKVGFLQRSPQYGLVYSAETRFDSATGETLQVSTGRSGRLLMDLLEFRGGLIHSPSGVVVRKTVLDDVGYFDPRLSTSADWELWTRLASATPFGYLDQPMVKYRVHSGQMHRNIPLMERDMLYAFEKCRSNGMFANGRHFTYCFSKLNLILAACYLVDQRDTKRFAACFLRSVWHSPAPLWERVNAFVQRERKPSRRSTVESPVGDSH